MAKDNIRRSDSRIFSSSEQNTLKIANDSVIKRLLLDVKLKLTSGATAATGPFIEGAYNIIKALNIDFDGRKRYNSKGVVQAEYEKWANRISGLPGDTLVAPAASSTNTIRFLLPIDFGLPFSDVPSMGFRDMSKFTNVYLNLTMGDISDLFSVVNNTVVTDITVDLYIHEILGVKLTASTYIEHEIITENLTASNSDKKIPLSRGDRDYLALILRTQSAPSTPANGIITGDIEIKGSEPNRGIFSLRKYEDETILKNENTLDNHNNAYTTGYSIIDFVRDGNYNGAIGTVNLTDFSIHVGVTGAASNKLDVISVTGMKGV